MSGQHTRNVTMSKCPCGHRACNQYILSTQRSAGFDESDARLYTAAPDLLEALRELIAIDEDATIDGADLQDRVDVAWVAAKAAIAKATGAA